MKTLVLLKVKGKDLLHNLSLVVLFMVYPIVAFVLTQTIGESIDMPVGGERFFVGIFGSMHCVFTPIVAASSIISEEKEKNILKVLMFANVSHGNYFASTGGLIWILTVISGGLYLPMGGYAGREAVVFMVFMGIGSLVSTILGSLIGLRSRNTTAASAISVPVAMVFAFVPMLSLFNDKIMSVARFTYGQQVSLIFMGGKETSPFGIVVILCNFAFFLMLAYFTYSRMLKDGI